MERITSMPHKKKARHGRAFLARRTPWRLRLALPYLTAAKQGEADVAVHVELLAGIRKGEFHFVDLAGLRVEDLAAIPLVAILADAPHDRHADDRLIFVGSVALRALGRTAVAGDVVRGLVHDLQHLALQFAVGLGDLDDRRWLASRVVHLFPRTRRRVI